MRLGVLHGGQIPGRLDYAQGQCHRDAAHLCCGLCVLHLACADVPGSGVHDSLLCNYMFEAIMFPTIFSIALTGLGNLTKTASSLLMMTPIGGCGFLLMGMIADRTHVVMPFVVPLVGFLIVLAYALREYRMMKSKA